MTGSDTPGGPDWWQGSDGSWHPPQATPTPPPNYTGPGANNASPTGFFARLFDFSFKEYITPSIIKLLFVIGTIVWGIFGLLILVSGLASDNALGVVLGLILGPLVALIGIIYVRVVLEFVMVVFSIERNTR